MEVREYVEQIQKNLEAKDPNQEEFLQAVEEFLPTVIPFLEEHPEYVEKNILGMIIEPERMVQFRVPWQDDKGNWQVNRGYRVQFNSAIGPRWSAFPSKCELKYLEVFRIRANL